MEDWIDDGETPAPEEVEETCCECGRAFLRPRWQFEEDIQWDDYEPYCGCADIEPPGP